MRERGLRCRPVSVCPSVRPSVRLYTLVDCIHVTEDIVKLLCWPDSSIILVFDSQRRYGQTDRQICYIDIALYMQAQADA